MTFAPAVFSCVLMAGTSMVRVNHETPRELVKGPPIVAGGYSTRVLCEADEEACAFGFVLSGIPLGIIEMKRGKSVRTGRWRWRCPRRM